MNIEIMQQNRQFLSPQLIQRLSAVPPAPLEWKVSKDGHPVPLYLQTALHSTYYPLNEAERIVMPARDDELSLVLGFGAGYHLIRLAQTGKTILCIPVNDRLLKAVLCRIDLNNWFSPNKLFLITENEVTSYFDYYQYRSFYWIIHPVIERIHTKETLSLLKEVNLHMQRFLLEMNTQRKFGRLWLSNIIRNIGYLYQDGYDFSPLSIDSRPVLITGAGPSLQENMDVIKKNREKLWIAASDTSYKVLTAGQIQPDAVFSFDVQTISYLHFTGAIKPLRLFTDFTSSIRFLKNQTPLFSNYPLHSVLQKAGFQTGLIPSDQRNIGGAMIDFFCRYFPDYPLITVGIDYGIHNHTLYSAGTYITDYELVNSDYFRTAQTIDADLLYRDPIAQQNNQWSSSRALGQYQEMIRNVTEQIYTLSDSPFVPYHKISSIEAIDSGRCKPACLEFHPPSLSRDQLLDFIIKTIEANPLLINSYLIHRGTSPDKSAIDQAIQQIRSWIKVW